MQSCRCEPPCVPRYTGAERSIRHHHQMQRNMGISVLKLKPGKKKSSISASSFTCLGDVSEQTNDVTIATVADDPFFPLTQGLPPLNHANDYPSSQDCVDYAKKCLIAAVAYEIEHHVEALQNEKLVQQQTEDAERHRKAVDYGILWPNEPNPYL
jgi:hypothetical protein